ncbi:MAG: hypothetical protein J6M55_04875 [Paludibacteraceae bacterium]|nr:hypothetical protein [Paludibacteraceae bacterium]
MKKIFIILMAAMVATGSVYAADNSKKTAKSNKAYNMSIGMVAGSGIGVQFKDMITDHFTIIEEFGYLGSFAAAGNGGSMPTIGAVDNLVLAYQAQCADGQGIRLDYYAGGQIKGGYIDMGAAGGIVGFGAAAGIEAKMKNAPIAFSFDFRPGYGCILGNDGMGNIGAFHTFDWTLNLGVRYTF